MKKFDTLKIPVPYVLLASYFYLFSTIGMYIYFLFEYRLYFIFSAIMLILEALVVAFKYNGDYNRVSKDYIYVMCYIHFFIIFFTINPVLGAISLFGDFLAHEVVRPNQERQTRWLENLKHKMNEAKNKEYFE